MVPDLRIGHDQSSAFALKYLTNCAVPAAAAPL
jgi:hypothetical protein